MKVTSNTLIYLNGKGTYRREHDVITRRKRKADVVDLVKNRNEFNVILCKNTAKKYDMIFQELGFYLAEIDNYSHDEYIGLYRHI